MNEQAKDLKIVTMNKHDFRKHILISFIIHICIAGIIYAILKMKYLNFHNLLGFTFSVVIGLCCAASFIFIFDVKKYNRRFRDIYPDSDNGSFWYLFAYCFPVFFFGLTIFLCFKDHVPHIRTPLRFRTVSLFVVPVFCLQLTNPSFSYYFASPTFFYLTDTITAAINLIGYKKNLKNSDNIVQNYLRKYDDEMKSTENVLLIAVAGSVLWKDESKISKSPEDIKYFLKNGEQLISSILEIQSIAYRNKFKATSYSPIQWLYPGAPFEILFLEETENNINNKYQPKVVHESLSIITNMESQVGRLPASEQVIYREKIQKQREQIYASESYKLLINQRLEKPFPIK
jgi:hypothetical protein